jgi:sugar-specific transcriptional regulator TrmB
MIPFDFFSRYSLILKNLGLSEYEIRVYLTLLIQGSLNYRDLCRDSGVPTGKIYQVLSALESKGFVEISQDRPKVCKAVEPKKALRRRLRQIEEDFFDLELKTREALQTLQLQYNLKYDEIQGIVSEVYVGGPSSTNGIRENLLKAEKEILFSTGEIFGGSQIENLCGVALERGVKIKAIVPKSSSKNIMAFDHLSDLGVNVRQLDSLAAKYFVVDDKYVSLLIDGDESETCVQIQGAALCRVLRERFMENWNKAAPFQHNLNSHGLIGNAESQNLIR